MGKVINYTDGGNAVSVFVTDEALAKLTIAEIAATVVPFGIPWTEDDQANQTPVSQRDIDLNRFKQRAEAKDLLIAEMAADNMARVRAGIWTVQDLTEMMSDPQAKAILELMNALSFELAAAALAQASHPLLTPQIKSVWLARLQENFFL